MAVKTKWHQVKPFVLKYALFPERKHLKKFLESIGSVEPEHTPASFSALCRVYSNGNMRFVAVEIGDVSDLNDAQILSALIHESVHVFQEACIDVREHKPSAEFEAYAIEHIAKMLFEDWAVYDASQKKKRKKGRKKK